MADPIAIAKVSMLADLERIRDFGQNITNASTTGYRRQVPFSIADPMSTAGSLDREYGLSGDVGIQTDLTAGAIKNTARQLDVALEGEGYLAVNTAEGVRYTRRGDLSLDSQGRLVTQAGDSVVAGGGEVVFQTGSAQSSAITISSDGEIKEGDHSLGKLRVVEFSDPRALEYIGNGLFKANTRSGAIDGQPRTRVRQNALETSNVRPVQDMTGMMEASRQFEMSRNAMMAYDTMLDNAINTLATF
jgi:flagellar basal-body rod protein FlgF